MARSKGFRQGLAISLALVGLILLIRSEAQGLAGRFVPSNRPEAPVPASDPLVTINNRFHNAYREARIQKLAEVGPVIVVGVQELALIQGTSRQSVPFPPAEYHKLKEVAHVPLLIFVTLSGTRGTPLDATKSAEVRYLRDLIDASQNQLDRVGFDASQIDRQRTILRLSRDYLETVNQSGKAPNDGLDAFARTLAPLVLANADDAAEAHLKKLNSTVESWRTRMTAEEWKSFHVVIMSAHMAREREVALQYFQKLFGETSEGRRIIMAEGVFEESKALELLGTHLLDGAASRAFFGDPERLHRDLLSDGGTKALQHLDIHP